MLEKLFSMGIDTNKFKEKKKSKITIFGDKSYDSTNIRTFISNNNMNCIIDYNNRNKIIYYVGGALPAFSK